MKYAPATADTGRTWWWFCIDAIRYHLYRTVTVINAVVLTVSTWYWPTFNYWYWWWQWLNHNCCRLLCSDRPISHFDLPTLLPLPIDPCCLLNRWLCQPLPDPARRDLTTCYLISPRDTCQCRLVWWCLSCDQPPQWPIDGRPALFFWYRRGYHFNLDWLLPYYPLRYSSMPTGILLTRLPLPDSSSLTVDITCSIPLCCFCDACWAVTFYEQSK